ncbi:MAG: ABC transporter ATP-binding protein [Castellaniella sp.]
MADTEKKTEVDTHVLQALDVSVHYGGIRALDGVSLHLRKGQVLGLIGPNGAGKSTVIDAITGRLTLTRGRIVLDGEDITTLSAEQRRKRGISRSFQRTSIFGGMSVYRQVELAAHMTGLADARDDALDILAELDLLRLRDTLGEDLGYGEQRRLDLALALAGRPRVLLLDEPMAGLTMQESMDMAEHLKALTTRRQVSVLLVEHDMDVVFRICDAVTVFELGVVIADGDPAAVRADARVREAYLGSAA